MELARRGRDGVRQTSGTICLTSECQGASEVWPENSERVHAATEWV